MTLFPDYPHNPGDENHPREASDGHQFTHHDPPKSSIGRCSGENTPVEAQVSKFESLLQRDSRGGFEEGDALRNTHAKIYHIIKNEIERKRKFPFSTLLRSESHKEINALNGSSLLPSLVLWCHLQLLYFSCKSGPPAPQSS